MLPAIGSVSALAGQGQVGVVVSARRIGEEEDGRQLVALRIREGEQAQKARLEPEKAEAATSSNPTHGQPDVARSARAAPSTARLHAELSPSEKAAVTELQQRDQQVKQEEKAHAAVAGDLAGPINYTYRIGPDGRQYAVGGSVGIRTSVTSGDPAEAKRQAGRVASAAHAATNPSAADYAAARQAYSFGSQLSMPSPDEHAKSVNLTF